MDILRAVGSVIKNLGQGLGVFLGGGGLRGDGGGLKSSISGGSAPELNPAIVKDTIILSAASLFQPKLSKLLVNLAALHS